MKKTAFLILLIALCGLWMGCNNPSTDPEDPSTPEASANDLVIYEANPKLFGASQSLNTITARLDSLKALGVNMVWLMPIYPIGQDAKSVGSPYCVSNYTAVNPAYGTLEDVTALVTAAHQRGIQVMLDWVANHTAWDHPWITAHPDWYTQEGGKIISPKEYNWTDVADLNYNSSDLRLAMQEAMLFWVKNYDIDAFRCDYANGVPNDFWQSAITAVRKEKSSVLFLGESTETSLYNVGFDMLYSWAGCDALVSLWQGKNSVENYYTTSNQERNQGQTMHHITNHDRCSENSPTTLFYSKDGALAAFVLCAFYDGVPMLYSSQEIGYNKTINFFSTIAIDWTQNPALKAQYARVLNAYHASQSARSGTRTVYTIPSPMAAFAWKNDQKQVYVVVNTSHEEQTFTLPMDMQYSNLTNAVTGESMQLSQQYTIAGNGFLICTL